jgi:hypothetical protein
LEIGNQPAADSLKRVIDARRQNRFRLAVDIKVNSKTCGIVKGHSIDISQSGISALLTLEVPWVSWSSCNLRFPTVQSRSTPPFVSEALFATVFSLSTPPPRKKRFKALAAAWRWNSLRLAPKKLRKKIFCGDFKMG